MRVYTTGQVAKIFSVNINTVIKWFDEGKLGGFRLPRSNERRIYRESVTEFMTAHDINESLLHAFDEERANRKRGRGRAPSKLKERSGMELRTFPRKPVELTGRLEVGSGSATQVDVRNLSMGGVYLTGVQPGTDKSIPTEFRIVMDTDQTGTLDGICQVVHMRRTDDQSMSLGCRFTQVDPGSLQSYLASL
jgi:excisionase family DNA binding protein